jgi:hypothetical protein
MRGVEPHSRSDKILSRGGSKLISKKIMLTPIHFLVPEVEEEVEEELSHVLRVVKMVIKPLTVHRGRWTKENPTSLKRRGKMLRMKTLEVGSH